MKIRNGFVSNSSSSSFVILLDVNECTLDSILDRVKTFNGEYISTSMKDKCAEVIHRDIQDALKRGTNNIEDDDIDASQIFDTFTHYDYWDGEWQTAVEIFQEKVTTEEFNKFQDIWAEKMYNMRKDCLRDMTSRSMRCPDGKRMVTISYGDEDGQFYSFLEHSGIVEHIFPNTIRNSQH